MYRIILSKISRMLRNYRKWDKNVVYITAMGYSIRSRDHVKLTK